MMILRISIAAFLLTLLIGCNSMPMEQLAKPPASLQLSNELFGERPDIISAEAVHALTTEQVDAFMRYFDAPQNAATLPHIRVYDYLEDVTTGFNYLGETYIASEALQESAGNCLALAILTTALAKVAGVEVGYQLTDSLPVFEARGDFVVRGRHVRSMLYDPTWVPKKGFLTLARPGLRVDYFPSDFDRFIGNISESEYMAMYFQNVAGDALVSGDLGLAYWLTAESLEHSPNNAESLNTLALVYDRAGDKVSAEEIYKFGLQHAAQQASLLRNYGTFLKRQGRIAEASHLESSLDDLNDPNPFDWLVAGQRSYEAGDYRQAIKMFERGVELAPYLHEAYFGLARANLRLGNHRLAKQQLSAALEHANRSSSRKFYSAKLEAMSPRERAN